MNDLIINEIAEQIRIQSAKEILKLSDTNRNCVRFIPAFLIDLSQSKNRLLRRKTIIEIIRKNE